MLLQSLFANLRNYFRRMAETTLCTKRSSTLKMGVAGGLGNRWHAGGLPHVSLLAKLFPSPVALETRFGDADTRQDDDDDGYGYPVTLETRFGEADTRQDDG